ncbi:hypothetical protein ACTHQ8_14910 [Lysinibacillus odysseyi]|uniref:Uncharacterized protein n=1 Tax=Lysinibacillus odysseyi 34hs-1 = NBRC 100172 TaxID=1220589 RepID=A0A0A3IZL6_9BACI|nr:hypothetical protein [Lysinibacillus odysseyi]KGR88890.1 hypothetical protein CD32_00910 [Lysinibacillus odysseyi 34hs-1 = NBRC 100172]
MLAQKIKEYNYVAYRIPDSANWWFEFIGQENQVCVSLVEDIERDLILDLFIYEPHKEFRYSSWKESLTDIDIFVKETLINAQKLLSFVSVLNPQLLKSENIKMVQNLIYELEYSL